jgi:uncharacterized protein YndB with AHSA1/START domain
VGRYDQGYFQEIDAAARTGNGIPNERIDYAFGDSAVHVTFADMADGVNVVVSFDAEQTHSAQQQRDGWQAVLDNVRQYVEARSR